MAFLKCLQDTVISLQKYTTGARISREAAATYMPSHGHVAWSYQSACHSWAGWCMQQAVGRKGRAQEDRNGSGWPPPL
jgi:hypothetical protein